MTDRKKVIAYLKNMPSAWTSAVWRMAIAVYAGFFFGSRAIALVLLHLSGTSLLLGFFWLVIWALAALPLAALRALDALDEQEAAQRATEAAAAAAEQASAAAAAAAAAQAAAAAASAAEQAAIDEKNFAEWVARKGEM